MCDFFLLFLSFIAKVTDIPSKLPIISENFFLPSKIRQKSKKGVPAHAGAPFLRSEYFIDIIRRFFSHFIGVMDIYSFNGSDGIAEKASYRLDIHTGR